MLLDSPEFLPNVTCFNLNKTTNSAFITCNKENGIRYITHFKLKQNASALHFLKYVYVQGYKKV